jgi:thioredoxin reductase (NADPH)
MTSLESTRGDTAAGVPLLQPPKFPLSPTQLDQLRLYATEAPLSQGEMLYSPGDASWDMFVVLAGRIDIFDRHGLPGMRVVVSYGPGEFSGEIGMLTGRRSTLTAIVAEEGRALRVPAEHLRTIVAEERTLSDFMLDALMTRRSFLLQEGIGVTLVGSRFDPETRRLLELLARNGVASKWLDSESSAQAALVMDRLEVTAADLPVLAMPGGPVLRKPSAADVRRALGTSSTDSAAAAEDCDLVVVGGGPGGLAAAVYGASEGLATTLLECTALGGQAGTSSRIENYLGFPAGLSGSELSTRAVVQAEKFGVRLTLAVEAISLCTEPGRHVITLEDGSTIGARSIIVATGAHYKRLPLERIRDFEGVGIYYAASAVEAQSCLGQEVAVVGGGNSAGQAALYLAETCATVHLLVRRDGLEETMSQYLIARIERHPKIDFRARTEVTRLLGDDALTGVDVSTPDGPATLPVSALFLFIGAIPGTEWLRGKLALDRSGFVLTGPDIPASRLDGTVPLPLETTIPGIFCVGDARSGSVKRVATAIGEGSMAVRLVFDRLPVAGPV